MVDELMLWRAEDSFGRWIGGFDPVHMGDVSKHLGRGAVNAFAWPVAPGMVVWFDVFEIVGRGGVRVGAVAVRTMAEMARLPVTTGAKAEFVTVAAHVVPLCKKGRGYSAKALGLTGLSDDELFERVVGWEFPHGVEGGLRDGGRVSDDRDKKDAENVGIWGIDVCLDPSETPERPLPELHVSKLRKYHFDVPGVGRQPHYALSRAFQLILPAKLKARDYVPGGGVGVVTVDGLKDVLSRISHTPTFDYLSEVRGDSQGFRYVN